MKKSILVTFLGLLVCLLCTVATGIAGVPQMINFQGRLTDEEDTALDDTLSITFSIYADSTGGIQLWTEINGSVIVSKGIFNVLLGNINPISDTVFTGAKRWLSMNVEGEEMEPPKPIASVGYAFHSATSDTAEYAHIATSDGDWTISGNNMYSAVSGSVGIGTTEPDEELHVVGNMKMVDGNQAAGKVLTSDASGVGTWQTASGGIPSGVIVMWWGLIGSIPEGWALCDGTNGTPDLRDRFIVGAGSSYIVGATGGEAFHTLTINEMPSHTHTTTWYEHGGEPGPPHPTGAQHTHPFTSTSNPTGGDQPHENRPPYYSLAYIMKL